MLLTSKRACQWNTIVLLTIGLAVAIFAWGLHYKLSLYQSTTRTVHHTDTGRFIADRERSADTIAQLESAVVPAFLVFCAVATLLAGSLANARQQSRWLLQYTKDPRLRPGPASMRRLYGRPPPRAE